MVQKPCDLNMYAPLKKEGHIVLHMLVSLPHLVQLITQERFASKVSNSVDK